VKFRVFWDVAPCSHVEVDHVGKHGAGYVPLIATEIGNFLKLKTRTFFCGFKVKVMSLVLIRL
jgi:hypothetical protein